MKRYISLLALIVILLLPCHEAHAKRKKRKKAYTISYVGGYVGAGYSQLKHDIPNTTIPGGGSGLLGFEYFLKHGKHFNFHLGVEGMYFNSLTRMNDMTLDSKFYYNDPSHNNLEIDYYMNFSEYQEQHNNLFVGIPIMLGGEFKQFYFAIGAKAKYGIMGYYQTNNTLSTFARDPEFIEDLENLPSHNIGTNNLLSKGKLAFGLDATASAEIGIILDPWLSSSATIFGAVNNRKNISYRLGLFADYGILNINRQPHTDMLIAFPGMQQQQDGRYIVPAQHLGNIYNNSLLATDVSINSHFNSFVIGVKFSVLVQASNTPMPPKKKARRRPIVRDVSIEESPIQEFICGIRDGQTQHPLNAQVVIFDINETQDTAFNAESAKEDGLCTMELHNSKRYGIMVSKDGYMNYKDTVHSLSDTLFVDLQPIKRNTVIILKNLFFDTDKTIIKNTSTESLEEMYQLLVDNPKIRVMITGHTDNVASDAYNIRLSEGRAKAVYDEMVRRGIDPKRMKWQGKGEREPIDTNKTEEGRAANRRVEFRIL